MKVLAGLLLILMLGCGVDRELAPLLIWVPGGGPQATRIRELVAEMGLSATFVSDREVLSLRPSRLRGVKAAVCFDGPGAELLNSSALAALPRQGGILLAAGQATVALAPTWGYQVRPTEDAVLRWSPAIWNRLPPGTFDPRDGTALTYGYGPKTLSGWSMGPQEGISWATDRAGRVRWIEKNVAGGGRLILAGLPLAAEAILGDSFQSRLYLERAAELAKLPRLWPTPEGKGVMLVNVHVDSKLHGAYLEGLLAAWPAQVRGTFHFTAGPDCDHEGDGKGFNVSDPAQGGHWVDRLARLGEVGSHGGWIHNVWALEGPRMPLAKRQALLAMNFKAMARWGKASTYSSPAGFHPGDLNTWLESQGIRGFYHTGEGGCPPTHAWLNGAPFGNSMWAFPVSALGANAATYEFKKAGVTESQVDSWFTALSSFCAGHREARMVYGHPVDFGDMPLAYNQGLLGTVDKAVASGRIQSWTMGDYAAFQDRRQRVRWSVTEQGERRVLSAGGPLRGMAFQLPGTWHGKPETGLSLTQEGGVTWIVVQDDRQQLEVKLWP